MWVWLLAVLAVVSGVNSAGAGAARLICYVESARGTNDFTECTHLVYAGNARGEKLETLLKDYRKHNARLKIVLRTDEVDKDLSSLLKSKHIQGLELFEAHKTLNKTKVLDLVTAARTALTSSGGGPLFLALPAHPELLAKYYDLRSLVKKVDLMMVETHSLGVVKKMTYHPSRLSGMWDMMNTDSVVDLVTGLGVPTSKVVISLPATARQFILVNETLSTPGSPTEEEEPKEIDQAELCRQLQRGRWTLERDQDLSAPYAFNNKTWISFEDSSSIDVKGKYARVRGLAGLALHHAEKDTESSCGPTLKAALAKVLNQQSRAPRAAVLRSLEHEILSAPGYGRALDALQVSPYRITQVVDSDGVIHSIREDTRTEFSCSRQGYFVHPRSCARFYRCVKFDQLSPEYTVFEFDCPAGLAFDSRYEVCVWPGSLAHSQACPGSSEIAPVPHTRFICPEHEGYYADPENCRWFFACLDHGKSPLTAYEFRCPFGLGFDAEQLKCDWPWKVPACGNIARYEAQVHGFSGSTLTGAVGYQGQTADAINVAAHQSLVSGASLNNLVGVQGGFLTKEDALDSNFIASQQLANAGNFGHGLSNQGLSHQAYQDISLIQPTNYQQPEYSSGSLILDDYRLPTNQESIRKGAIGQANVNIQNGNSGGQSYNGYTLGQKTAQYSTNYDDNSGAYVHDPSGDYAEPYRHVDSPVQPYLHQGSQYKQSSDYYDVGKYSGQNYQYTSGSQNGYEGKYKDDNSGQYVEDNSGAYIDSGNSYAGSYGQDDSGKYQGVYRADGHIGEGKTSSSFQQYNQYSAANAGNYINDAKAYTGGSHTLTAGAINVGLVGKTTLVDAEYNNQNAYKGNGYSHSTFHVSQPAVAINHVGTDFNNLDGYSFVTTPTSSGIPTTATPFAVTTALPTVTYKTTFVPEPAKTSIKQIFGVSQPAVTYVQPTVAVKQVPQVYLTENQGSYQETKESGYQYSKPSIQFEDGISYTTAAPAVSTYKPSFSQQTVHQVSSGLGYSTPSPVYEEPFKKVVAYTTGPSINTYDAPTVATYTPQAFSHQTIHKVESNNAYTPTVQSGYVYEEPKIQYTTARPEPAIESVTPQVISHQTLHKVDASKINSYSEESGYNYEKPAVQFEEVKTVYSTPAPIVASYKPQSYSQQTIHKVEAQQYVPTPKYQVQYQSTPVTYYKNPILEYTEKAAPVTYVQPTYKSQAISHQTIHKVENSNVNLESGYQYNKPSVVQYTTPQPIVVSSTYEPKVYSHQTLHKVENANVNLGSGYEYSKPVVKYQQPNVVQYTTPQPTVVSSTYEPQVYSHQTLHKVENANVNLGSGYQYDKPVVTYEQPSVFQYTTPQPVVVSSTYEPQVFSQQTVHKVEQANVNLGSGYEYSKPVVKYEQPSVVQYTTPQPAVVSSTYEPQVYSHQTLHKVENANVNLGSGYQYNKPEVRYEQPSEVQYTTPQPIVVSSTYEPQVFSQQTVHKVDASQVKTYQESNQGYEYKQPAIKFVETPKVFEYSTPTPIVTSTYKPQIYSQQTVHKVETQKYIPVSTPAPVYQPAVTRYENPLLKYTQKGTPITYVQPTVPVFTQTYKPIVQQQQITHSLPIQEHISQEGYSYSQPEIQRNFEGSNGYSDASVVSHQTFHQANVNSYQNKNVILSTVPSTLVYEDHYVETPKVEYKAPEYIPPKNDYKSYSYVSSTAAPVVHQSSIVHQAPTYLPPKTDYQYSVSSTASTPIQQETYDYSQYETVQKSVPSVQQVSFSTSHIEQPQKVESIHFSFPSSTPNYQQVEYQAPEIQVGYKAEEYLPPVVSTQAPVVTSTYRPRTYSTTTREYLPPVETKYEYLPPSTTARPIVKTTPIYTESTTYKADEYLPPDFGAKVVNYETYNTEAPRIKYNPYRDYSYTQNRKQNIVVQTAKANQLGFGTVGPDAGLVSPVTYTTAAPIVTSTYRQRVKSTTPAYRYKSTTYKAPEYLPPDDSQLDIENYEYNKESSKIKYNPYQEDTVTAVPRKQNIVVETSKSNLLGFGTVGPDAGLVSSAYTTAGPVVVSSTESYSLSPKTESYTPVEQGLYEVTSPAPRRRTKPKVAVVTKINDFNPFLVRKLGAVCSCQSPVLVLRGKKPSQVPQQDFSDFNDYDDAIRGDVQDNEYAQRLTKIQSPISVNTVSTPAPYVSSTFNPIIVPDDSYYQDLQEQNNYEVDVTPKQKQVYSENYVSSTPYAASTTEKYVRVRQRVKAVTPAPTYETILLNKDVTPTITIKDSESAAVDSQSFDRYGPGGWRSRDETLQGSVDCQRAGLFRHPKQCNKFYACRWDCTKQRFTLHVFNCPVQLSFDPKIGACNWPSQGPACQGDTLLTNVL